MLTLTERRQRLRHLQLTTTPMTSAIQVLQAAIRRSDQYRLRTLARLLTKNSNPNNALPYTIILKPVGNQCNLQCQYCFNRSEQPSTVMAEPILSKAIASALATPSHSVHFVWHGGEPLLAGLNFFERAVDLQHTLNRNNKIIQNAIQTNGTMLSEQWLNFFNKHDFKISISLDGPAFIHNTYRRYGSGKGSFNQVLNHIKRLPAYRLNYGIVAVITHSMKVTPEDFLDFFVTHEVTGLQISPCIWPHEIALLPGEYADFATGLFDAWLDQGWFQIRINPFEDIITALMGYPPRLCWMAGTCTQFISVEPNGEVWPCCDRTLPSQYCWGNLLDADLSTIIQGAPAHAFRSAEQQTPCTRHCQWSFLCRGGCVQHRIVRNGSVSTSDPLCPDYQQLFKHIADRIDQILIDCEVNFHDSSKPFSTELS